MSLLTNISLGTYLVSDTHLDHSSILKFCSSRKKLLDIAKKRETIEDVLVERIWGSLSNSDMLLHLGDFAFKGITKYSDRIKNVPTVFLPGNHDKKSKNYYLHHGFKEVVEGIYIEINGRMFKELVDDLPPFCNFVIKEFNGVRVLFSHFPLFHGCIYDKEKPFYKGILKMEEYFHEFNCDLNIHGHTHEENSKFDRSFNVSVENIDFKPITVEEVLNRVA